jgi:antitoxin component of RelBE/YafQ-DinJ toxin-antitoxin module
MARPKSKESKAVNINMDVTVLQELEKYCEETGLTKTVAIERILKQFFEEQKQRKEG